MERVLVIAAHPDDEVLGVGGTAARHAAQGDKVQSFIVAQGATSRTGKQAGKAVSAKLERLRSAARAAAKVLDSRPPLFGELPDNRLDSLDLLDVVKAIEAIVEEVRPTIIYTHYPQDLNVDHAVVARAVMTAVRPLPKQSVHSVLAFETVSSTEWHMDGESAFDPNHFVEISPFLKQKRMALKCYADELREFPHPRSFEAIEHLARWRGAVAGVPAAEAFRVMRHISRI